MLLEDNGNDVVLLKYWVLFENFCMRLQTLTICVSVCISGLAHLKHKLLYYTYSWLHRSK